MTTFLEVARREGAHSYDARGAEYTHRDGLCSFEVLVEDYGWCKAEVDRGAAVFEERD